MLLRIFLFVSFIILGAEGQLHASEEEYLPWREVHIVCTKHKATGKVVFSGKMAGETYKKVNIEAFGKHFAVAKEDLQKLNKFPLHSLTITHEPGYKRHGGHMVHFKMKVVYYDEVGRLIEERVVVSVSRGRGLTVANPEQRILNAEK